MTDYHHYYFYDQWEYDADNDRDDDDYGDGNDYVSAIFPGRVAGHDNEDWRCDDGCDINANDDDDDYDDNGVTALFPALATGQP